MLQINTQKMGKVIGIDFGTTNSVVAFYGSKNPEIILTPEGDRLLPSVVVFTKTGERLIGNPAKTQLITNVNSIYSVKRLHGKRFSEIEPYLYQFTYEIVEGRDDTLKIKINDTLYSPEEISAMIFQRLKDSAEHFLNDTIEGAVITVPAYFNDSQRQATKDAGEIAGLKVLRIINEPTAASLAFSLDLKKKQNIVVYDFGGGTIDISVLEVKDDVIKVLSTAGDINLGGVDFDVLISRQLVEDIKNEFDIDLTDKKLAIQRIRDAAENAKKELSGIEECEINLPFIADTNEGPIHFQRYFNRSEFESLIRARVEKTLEICKIALMKANLSIEEIDEILLVGGSTRIPFVQRKVCDFFKKTPNKKINPDEVVAIGAAIQGSIIKGESKDILLLDVIPLSLGVKTFGGVFTRVIDANTTIPINRSLVFSTAEDNQSEVEINVYQGEREIAEENKFLGKFTLPNIKSAPKGVPRIEVNFNININGILKVSAIDLSTKNKKEVVVSQTGLLSDEEITRIKKEAELYREQDLVRKQLLVMKSKVLTNIYSIERFVDELKLDSPTKTKCKSLIKKGKKEVENENSEGLKSINKELQQMYEILASIKEEYEEEREAKRKKEKLKKIETDEEDAKEKETGKKKASDTQPFKILDPDTLD